MSVKREMTRKPPRYGHSAAKDKNGAALYPAEFVCVMHKSTLQHLEGKDVFLHTKSTMDPLLAGGPVTFLTFK